MTSWTGKHSKNHHFPVHNVISSHSPIISFNFKNTHFHYSILSLDLIIHLVIGHHLSFICHFIIPHFSFKMSKRQRKESLFETICKLYKLKDTSKGIIPQSEQNHNIIPISPTIIPISPILPSPSTTPLSSSPISPLPY